MKMAMVLRTRLTNNENAKNAADVNNDTTENGDTNPENTDGNETTKGVDVDVDESNTNTDETKQDQDTTADANVDIEIGENKDGGELGNTITTNDNVGPKTEQVQGNEQNDDKKGDINGSLSGNAEDTGNLRGSKQTVAEAK